MFFENIFSNEKSGELSPDVFEQRFLGFIHDRLDLTHGHIKLLGQFFVGDSVKQPALQDRPVALGIPADDPFINSRVNA